MGTVGDAYDNATCERSFGTLEWELLDRRRFRSQADNSKPDVIGVRDPKALPRHLVRLP
jgi:hypothetical protein